MVHVAEEMQRQNFDVPLLIGGATTSKAHTAVKIEPAYTRGPTIYVSDASRSVRVATSLLSQDLRDAFVGDTRDEYAQIRERSSQRASKRILLSLEQARANAPDFDWETYTPPVPARLGVSSLDVPLTELVPFIDWSPFFMTWELAGKYPKILDDEVVGESARSVFADAQEILEQLISEGRLKARAAYGLWPANRDGDDIVVWSDESRSQPLERLNMLRQQSEKPEGQPNYCLADFVAPVGVPDYVGAFAVTAGDGIDAVLAEHEHDDYTSIMIKALADRLAEALAEYLHRRVRIQEWGYASGENLDTEQLIRERYQGIRPAPGYPACPEHSEKAKLFKMLDATRTTGIVLTESFAMLPAASVSGWYFSHPESRYFGVGKIAEDQVRDYADRKHVSVEAAEKLLRPNL
jgi:5-methyltetrahydrofolate--homocysteine methyltransferase